MGLSLVATPIGNLDDISLRALKSIEAADIIIGEEAKIARRYLAHYGFKDKIAQLHLLNEHAKAEDITELVELCSQKNVVYFSDCGTPSFCDPGFELVKACRQKNISITVIPGASAITSLISFASQKLNSFTFLGFLHREKQERRRQWKQISQAKENIIIMDTPYRMQQTLSELVKHCANKNCLLGVNLTKENETTYDGRVDKIKLKDWDYKGEFILLIYKD